jgi:hypothetical protein
MEVGCEGYVDEDGLHPLPAIPLGIACDLQMAIEYAMIDHIYELYCDVRFPLPTERDVLAFEKRLKARLPADYREFILKYNGGFFGDPCIASLTDDCPKDGLNSLYGIRATVNSSELANNLDIFTGNDPLQVLPIGYTTMGNLLILFIGGDDEGTIMMKRASSQQYYFLADGIELFFSLIRDPSYFDEDES